MAKSTGLNVQVSYKKEYLATDEEQPDGVVTKYIEAESGQRFSIIWNFGDRFPFKHNDIMSSVSLDGKFVDCLALASEKLSEPEGCKVTLSGARVKKDGKWYELPFSFADIIIDEDNHGLHDAGLKEKVGSLGEISLSFWRIEKLGESESGGRMPSFAPLNTIPEKALKGRAVSQQAALGDACRLDVSVRTWDIRYIDPQDKPFQVFNFRYRSRSGLQALGLIPRTPETTRGMVKRQQELDADSQVKTESKLKREREDGDEDDDAERKVKRQNRSHDFENIETIDLTGD